jgi:penicillin-binding protein 2
MLKNRNTTIFSFIFILFIVLIIRLFYLQAFAGKELSKAAVNQRTMNSHIDKPRGDIVDRNMIPFTSRTRKYSVVLKPLYLRGNDEDLLKVCEILQTDYHKIKKEIEAKNEPIFLEIDEDKKNKIADMKSNGISLINSLKRYDSNSVALHVLGYLNGVDGTGEAGIERAYEEILKYDRGDTVSVTTDIRNDLIQGYGYRLLKVLGDNKKLNVKLTLDYHIQKIVEDVMDKNNVKGAVVVEDVINGDILAMASKPDFEHNRVEQYLESPRSELFNRAVASYNLGSIFKIIDAALFLEEIENPYEEYLCTGSIKIGEKEFKCYSYDEGGHGPVDLPRAFALSCNPYFIHAGLRTGYGELVKKARSFGIGEVTGIKYQGVDESSGNLPPADNYYSDGDIANISIGQGEIMATPLQVADIVATVANGGIKNRINIVDSIVDASGNKVRDLRIKEGNRIIPKEVADKIKELMEDVIDFGTGAKAGLGHFGGTAGKTGSAETSNRDIVHAWFAGYFPRRNPRYSVCVFIEGGGSGGDTAAPVFAQIAKEIMKKGL